MLCTRILLAHPVLEPNVLRGAVSLPLILASERRMAPRKLENTSKGSRMLFLDVVIEACLIFERYLRTLRTGVLPLIALERWLGS
jgi:hypothetical protein